MKMRQTEWKTIVTCVTCKPEYANGQGLSRLREFKAAHRYLIDVIKTVNYFTLNFVQIFLTYSNRFKLVPDDSDNWDTQYDRAKRVGSHK